MSGKQPIQRITPVAPTPSLLTSARPLPAGVNWSTGIAWTPLSCTHASHNWQRCPDLVNGNPPEMLLDAPNAPVATDPFVAYTGLVCAQVTTEGGDRLTQAVEELVDVQSAWAMSRALWLGEGLATIPDELYGLAPTLRRVAVDVSINGHAALLDDVMATLLHAYSACTGGLGGATVHLPDALVVAALGGGDGGARVMQAEGSVYRGPLGSVVSPGPGYPHGPSAQGASGFGPLVNAGPPEVYQGNGYDEVWVYVTGPVEYELGPIVPQGTDAERRAGARRNLYEVIATREAIVRFDPCCVFAARAVNSAGEAS